MYAPAVLAAALRRHVRRRGLWGPPWGTDAAAGRPLPGDRDAGVRRDRAEDLPLPGTRIGPRELDRRGERDRRHRSSLASFRDHGAVGPGNRLRVSAAVRL